VRHLERAGVSAVPLHVPAERLYLARARLVVAPELVHPVVDVPPNHGELAGDVHGHALPAVGQRVERDFRELILRRRLVELFADPVEVPRELLCDLHLRGDLRDGACLLDGDDRLEALSLLPADPVERARQRVLCGAHACAFFLCWSAFGQVTKCET
jgi:hypothetical protein